MQESSLSTTQHKWVHTVNSGCATPKLALGVPEIGVIRVFVDLNGLGFYAALDDDDADCFWVGTKITF